MRNGLLAVVLVALAASMVSAQTITETNSAAIAASVAFLESTLTVAIDPASLSDPAVHGQAVATAPDGIPIMCEAKNIDATATPNAVTEGQYARPGCTPNGFLGITIVAYDGLTSPIVNEDVGETASNALLAMATVRRDVAASSAGATGDWATPNTDALGLLWTRSLDPCSGVEKSFIPIDITTATTTELTAALAGASTHYYVCAINLVTTAANSVALVDDDTDNCASVTSGLNGGLTAAEGWAFAANGGIALGNGGSSVMKTNGTNRVLCLVTSAATELHGTIVVAAAP